jgi:hypothetical protein
MVAERYKINPIQESLLRLFNRDMSDEDVLQLKRILVAHYSTLLKQEVERVIVEKGYTQADFDAMLNAPS